MLRLDQGQPLRDAMASEGLSIADLVARTQAADPTGYGVKRSTIGHLIATGRSARQGCDDRAGQLIATALRKQVGELFKTNPSP